ncbi:hypothetical protein [Egicoccus halophilus]|uniref:Uncharacterized protein n=1 Tax=Egicoccus halophilus TaxID=1670830 RepID=A0A8J3A535_9ACTN|nr:hypothetical protein [Egicoccus halophilus]GGI02935.1 hypothetical protein GCM10011354_02050 [Egicoccus halophilus]
MPTARRTGVCDQVRELFSASADGEASTGAREHDHLRDCGGCRTFVAALPRLERQVQGARGVPAPQLTADVLVAITAEATAERERRVLELRWLIGLAGVAQLLLAIPLIAGLMGPVAHVGRDLGALELALGIGLLFAAWQPERAAGVLPIAAVVATAAVVTGALDLAAGRATLLQELPHLTEIVGVLALWALTRRLPRPRLVGAHGAAGSTV